ncbi:flagellar biosynthesis protein FlhB [Buchnera aphidicola]|uniref:flagellar biosynthesis protein FlhB n=1 Tax=Buchnera aphidicola TaxID=9 RepID=UPI001650FAD2|nr:flagellar biosynthesis protein FlhB [Buchnera aphidicola]
MRDDNNEEKTESPTHHRLERAKKEGNSRHSRELNSFLILISFLIIFWINKYNIVILFENIVRSSFVFDNSVTKDGHVFGSNSVLFLKAHVISILKIIFFPIFLTILLSIIFSNSNFHIKSLKFSFSKLNPISGLKRLFSIQIIVELFKSILKILLVSYVVYFYVSHFFLRSLNFTSKSVLLSLKYSFSIIFSCILTILIMIIPIVVFDIFWEKYAYYKKLRMTRKEILDEFKKTEGNPQIRSRIRQTMRASMRRRIMLSSISKSDVIVVNATHYAIALQYNENSMIAPKVLAKGSGELALKIREIGDKYSIPVLFSLSLARVLYHYTDIGQYIPSTLYAAVAEVLTWVWKVRDWKKKGGTFPNQPHNFFIPLELRTLKKDKN